MDRGDSRWKDKQEFLEKFSPLPEFTRSFVRYLQDGVRPPANSGVTRKAWDIQQFLVALEKSMKARGNAGPAPTLRTVSNWRRGDIPQERFLIPILDTFFGNDAEYADQRVTLTDLWSSSRRTLRATRTDRLPGGDAPHRDSDSAEPNPTPWHQGWEISDPENACLGLAAIFIHTPERANSSDTFLLQATVSLAEAPDEIEGYAVTFGLRAAHLVLDYRNCQPLKIAECADLQERGGLFDITGPKSSSGLLAGRPLNNETLCTMEVIGDGVPGITLELRSRRRDLDVISDESGRDISAAKARILQTFLQECHRGEADRFVVWGRARLTGRIPP